MLKAKISLAVKYNRKTVTMLVKSSNKILIRIM